MSQKSGLSQGQIQDFPLKRGATNPLWGVANLQDGHSLVKMHVKALSPWGKLLSVDLPLFQERWSLNSGKIDKKHISMKSLVLIPSSRQHSKLLFVFVLI